MDNNVDYEEVTMHEEDTEDRSLEELFVEGYEADPVP